MRNFTFFLNSLKSRMSNASLKSLCVIAVCFAFVQSQTVWANSINKSYFAIQSEINGTVLDANGNPLPGVNITVKNTKRGTQTDFDGSFKIAAAKGDILVFSMVGMLNAEIPVHTEVKNMVVNLLEAVNALEEVVLVGYGTKKKSELTGAISNIKSDEILRLPTSNLSNTLAGRLSGTYVQSSTGTPGISSNVRIRGNSSWNTAPPVYVIDGVVRDKFSFDALDANEIDEITILKDAASAAIYGSRSSNGVVLVSTKKGKKGKVNIDFFTTYGTERTGKLPAYMPLRDGLELTNKIYGGYSQEDIDWAVKNNPKGENLYNEAYENPSNQKHAINVSGGSDNVKYFLGGSFFNENGFLPNVWFKKSNLRANVEAKINRNLTAKINLSNNYGTRNRFNFDFDNGSDDLNFLWGSLLFANVFDVPYIDGKPTTDPQGENKIEVMRNGGYWRNQTQQSDALINLTYNIPSVPGLSAGATFSKNIQNSFVKTFAKKQLLYLFEKDGENNKLSTNKVIGTRQSAFPIREYIGNESTKGDSYQLNFQLNYDQTFGAHTVNATAIYEQYESDNNWLSGYRYNFPLYPTDQFFAASKNNSDWAVDGREDQDGRLSYIGRVNYDFAKKYFISVSARYDGSIKFSPEQRWGLFPSASLAWAVSNEEFYKNSGIINTLNNLKFRFSYGSTGNDAIGGWQWLEQYNISNFTYYRGAGPGNSDPVLTYGGIPNKDLTWEKSDSYNLGVDLGFTNNLNLTVDLWKRHTYDILGQRILVLPNEFGGSLPATNYGIVDTKGLDFELNYGNKIGKDFNFNIKTTFGLSNTEVIKRDYPSGAQDFENPIGKTLNYGIGYRASGIIRTQEDIDKLPANYSIFGARPELGMMNFEDLSGPNGKPDGKIDQYDKDVLGNYYGAQNAPISFGLGLDFTYRNFSVNMLFAGLAGFDLFYNDAFQRNYSGGGKVPIYHADPWFPENPNGTTPKIFPNDDPRSRGYTENSTFNSYDGSFVRMKNLSLTYSINPHHLENTGIAQAQIIASASNLFLLTKFKFYDPEITQFMSYPLMKSFNIGLNVQF